MTIEIDVKEAGKSLCSCWKEIFKCPIGQKLEQYATERARFRRAGIQLGELTKVSHYDDKRIFCG